MGVPHGDVALLAGPPLAPGALATPIFLEPGHGVADALGLLSADTCLVVPPARSDVLLGLVLGIAGGLYPTPTAVLLAGPGQPDADVLAVWRTQMHRTPILQLTSLEGGRGHGPTAVAGEPASFTAALAERARNANRHIVLPEGTEPRILQAAAEVLDARIARITLLGDEAEVRAAASTVGADISGAAVVDPATSPLRGQFAATYAELRRAKGVTEEQAYERVGDVSYFGTMMVQAGLADGMVSGAVNTTAHTIRPAFEVIRTAPGVEVVSSVFLMCLADRVLVYGDCAVNPNPTAAQLADIAVTSADTAAGFGIEPRVAMLSYATGGSGSGPDVDLVAEATRLARERAPRLAIDGPLQYDAAVVPDVARRKAPDSPVAGQASVLVFPDLSAGNIAYKAVQRSADALAIGPILQGLNKPVNDLSRGALVADIVNTIAVTAIQAGERP